MSKLIDNIKHEMEKLAKAMNKYPWEDKRAYGAYIAQTYYYSRYTTRLLALAASGFALKDEKTHQRFLKHIKEENNHEILAVRDLTKLGYKVEDFHEFLPLKSFYQSQFYYIEHVSPWAFFGYILALEGLSVLCGKEIYERTKKEFGDTACNFLRVHIGEDEVHLEEAFQQISNLDENAMAAIYESTRTSCYLFERMLIDIAEDTNHGLKKVA